MSTLLLNGGRWEVREMIRNSVKVSGLSAWVNAATPKCSLSGTKEEQLILGSWVQFWILGLSLRFLSLRILRDILIKYTSPQLVHQLATGTPV